MQRLKLLARVQTDNPNDIYSGSPKRVNHSPVTEYVNIMSKSAGTERQPKPASGIKIKQLT